MKKFIFILFILAAITYLFLFKNNRCQNDQAKIYKINSKNYCLLTADTQDEWEKGLMFYKKPVDFDGMIFIFPEKQIRSFWNKNTYMDLDLYWMDGKKIIGKSFLPSILKSKNVVTVSSEEEVNRVVEIVK
jgi:hypothetical protein